MGRRQDIAPTTRWSRARITSYLRGFGLPKATADAIAKRWDDDADLAFWEGYDSGQDSMSDY